MDVGRAFLALVLISAPLAGQRVHAGIAVGQDAWVSGVQSTTSEPEVGVGGWLGVSLGSDRSWEVELGARSWADRSFPGAGLWAVTSRVGWVLGADRRFSAMLGGRMDLLLLSDDRFTDAEIGFGVGPSADIRVGLVGPIAAQATASLLVVHFGPTGGSTLVGLGAGIRLN